MDISKRIRIAGEPTGQFDRRRRKVCKVHCQGCGKEIRSDDDLSGVEYVKTKRGTELFFHTECLDSVWKRKIV